MPPSSGRTTVPGGASTVRPDWVPKWLALVIAWSKAEPQRVGQLAFFPFGERLLVGRGNGDGNDEGFAHFVTHRPGETPAVDPHEPLLLGDSLSRRHMEVRSTGNQLETTLRGESATYVNGAPTPRGATALVQPGDTIRVRGELLLLCVSRPRVLISPAGPRAPRAFGEPDPDGITGESPEMWMLRAAIVAAAEMGEKVLVRGESGTGKELVAAAIHRHGPRAAGPYVSVNVSALADTLLASELFGNLKGYPNPGMPARPGLVGQAHGGTLLLDEVGDISKEAQARMLRFLDQGEYLILGDATPRRVDLLVIGATHQGDERLREDFLARFKTRVHLPPLRERREDIPLLVRQRLIELARDKPKLRPRVLLEPKGKRPEPNVDAHLVEYLLHHPLRTNVREVHRILLDAIQAGGDGPLTAARGALQTVVSSAPPLRAPRETPPSLLPDPQAPVPRGRVRDDAPTQEVFEAAYRQRKGNVTEVAKELGTDRGMVYRLMKKWGIERKPKGSP